MRWMNLEPITQSEMIQKEKDKYHILTHIYRIQKNGTEEFIYRVAMEKQTQRILMDMGRGEERVRCMERVTWKLTLPRVKQMCVYVLVAQSCPTLCNPIDCSPTGPSTHGILQTRTLEWVAISFSKRNQRKKESEVIHLCPTLCDPTDCSLPGSSIHGIFQAGVLEWAAISFSKIDNQQEFALWLRKLKQGLCINLER